jgi:hypothetical protein
VRHFLQLHRVEKYGQPVPTDRFIVFTNKCYEMTQASPGIVWLIASEGQPKRYSISWRFECDGFTSSDNPDFRYAVIGKTGQYFDPPLPLSEGALKLVSKVTGQFRYGFTELDQESIKELEALVKPKKKVKFERVES